MTQQAGLCVSLPVSGPARAYGATSTINNSTGAAPETERRRVECHLETAACAPVLPIQLPENDVIVPAAAPHATLDTPTRAGVE